MNGPNLQREAVSIFVTDEIFNRLASQAKQRATGVLQFIEDIIEQSLRNGGLEGLKPSIPISRGEPFALEIALPTAIRREIERYAREAGAPAYALMYAILNRKAYE